IPEAHRQEHSIEAELPFLQRTLKNWDLVPILMGNPSLDVCKDIGIAIAKVTQNKKAVIIASADMSHFPSYDNANMVDKNAIKGLENLDPTKLKQRIDNLMAQNIPGLACVFCGEGAVYTTMYASKARGAYETKILNYANSGDTPVGDKNRVVGYVAAVFIKKPPRGSTMPSNHQDAGQMPDTQGFSIRPENRKVLLNIARKSISTFLNEKKLPRVDAREDDELQNNAAVFVTLTKKGNLRGCIGTTEARYPLIDAINQLAVGAAFQDYRFTPVTADELDDIHIEISVLSPLEKIKNPDKIKPGLHGVVVQKGNRSGLFLPQVWEHFPNDKEAFMGELCWQKAGLSRDAWKEDPDVELYTFTVFSFEEPKLE
ncbi:MAG: AmmeMemoRadiSam system protein A, partial [Elusimicrobia bacterium]|nr:AmmeMemoRadiSam system protein A [Elusimicrobiota bacterium]MBD3411547.1 AmmeMemoRadiSam system protein A [Elusimicrobiota bacterium]